jgi:hypothetical protein
MTLDTSQRHSELATMYSCLKGDYDVGTIQFTRYWLNLTERFKVKNLHDGTANEARNR